MTEPITQQPGHTLPLGQASRPTEPITQQSGQAPPPPGTPSAGTANQPPPGQPPSRRSAVTAVRVVTATLAVLIVGIGAFAIATSFFVQRDTATRSFSSALTRVNVSTDSGDVRVRAGRPGEATRVQIHTTKTFSDPQWSASVTGTVMDVKGTCDLDVTIGYNVCEVDFDIIAPPGAALQLTSNTGDMRVHAAQNGVTARTDTGQIRLIDVGGNVQLESDVGDIDGIRLTGQSFDVESDTGDVRMSFEAPPERVAVRTDLGDVDVFVPDDGTAYQVSTPGNGGISDVSIDVPTVPTGPRTILVDTSTGDVSVAGRGR